MRQNTTFQGNFNFLYASECAYLSVNVPMLIVVIRFVFWSSIWGITKKLKSAFGDEFSGIIYAHMRINVRKLIFSALNILANRMILHA